MMTLIWITATLLIIAIYIAIFKARHGRVNGEYRYKIVLKYMNEISDLTITISHKLDLKMPSDVSILKRFGARYLGITDLNDFELLSYHFVEKGY